MAVILPFDAACNERSEEHENAMRVRESALFNGAELQIDACCFATPSSLTHS